MEVIDIKNENFETNISKPNDLKKNVNNENDNVEISNDENRINEMNIENQEKKTEIIKKNTKKIIENVFEKAIITRNINIKINYIGKNFRDTIETILKQEYEGKCVVEGYIKPNSIKLISYSSGLIQNENIEFVVVFECLICFPVEGMIISCVVKNITKAGIRAESEKDKPSPYVLFISRDHHYNNSYFNSIKINDKIKAKVIGQRYELNDTFISIIGELKYFKNEVM